MFELSYSSADDIPAEVKYLYRKADDDSYTLVGAAELKTVNDVNKIHESLRKEREDHKATKRKLSAFNNLDPTEIYEKLDRFDELELAAGGKLDDQKINEMVETRLKGKIAPLERQIQTLQTEKGELEANVATYQGNERKRTIHDHIRKAAVEAKIRDTAVDDALMIGEHLFEVTDDGSVVTRDGLNIPPGLSPSVWFTEVKVTRPHWWPDSQGAGAKGSNRISFGKNPFSAESWNLTEQGKILRQDRNKAEQLARSAGIEIGQGRPAAK